MSKLSFVQFCLGYRPWGRPEPGAGRWFARGEEVQVFAVLASDRKGAANLGGDLFFDFLKFISGF